MVSPPTTKTTYVGNFEDNSRVQTSFLTSFSSRVLPDSFPSAPSVVPPAYECEYIIEQYDPVTEELIAAGLPDFITFRKQSTVSETVAADFTYTRQEQFQFVAEPYLDEHAGLYYFKFYCQVDYETYPGEFKRYYD